MEPVSAEVGFVGEPFDALAYTAPTVFAQLRAAVAAAHEQSLRAQDVLQRAALRRLAAPREGWFKPLARTGKVRLDGEDLRRLGDGRIAEVFGPQYEQFGANPALRPAVGLLARVDRLAGRDGLTAVTVPLRAAEVPAAVAQAAQVAAVYLGLHLCLGDATLTAGPARASGVSFGGVAAVEILIKPTSIDLVPRPHLTVDGHVRTGGRVTGLTVTVTERDGAAVGAETGGLPGQWTGRVGRRGERAVLNEFHLAHFCRGDQGLALGPEFAGYTGRKATRPPDGGLLLVDRIIAVDARRGRLQEGSHRTEYDSPADAWYYADTANASMPNCVYMETALQAALMLGYWAGPTLADPGPTVSLRNLGGTTTVLREADLRDTTLFQTSRLLSTSLVPGATLQQFDFELAAHDAPLYRGETLFGYFSDAAMANQTGLDAGREVPTWLAAAGRRPDRTLDVAARRADPGAPLVSRGTLALLDAVDVVDGGGVHGLGYLHLRQPIDPGAWFFARHFRYDPVIPGSLGVETVIQALQEWALAAGLADGLARPGFVLPAGVPFTWKYRGQFLPTDGEVVAEVHISSVTRRPGRVRVLADASLWKPGLRIYQLDGVGVELREEGAPPW